MKKIRKFSLQNMEHYQFASRVLQLCNEAKVEKLTAVLGPLAACVAAEDRVLNQPRTGADTKALEEADRKRDKSYQSLRLLVALHLNSADKAVLAAAEAVDRVMKAYPDVAASNYDKETGLIKNLVADLRTAALAPHVARLQAQGYINLLDADNKAFDTLFHARVKSGAPAGSFDIKPLRAATDKALNAVLRRIDALDELEPSAPITALITQYNNLVDNRRTLLAGRAATNKAHADKQAEELRKELEPLIRQFEEANGIAPLVLQFTGKTKGSGKDKTYELGYTTNPQKKLWVRKDKDGGLREAKSEKAI
ncbi:MAG: DUF6261 family protein [Hoylesella enoeca]